MRAGVVAIAAADGEATNEHIIRQLANRFLPADCNSDEYCRAALELLDVEPRFVVRESNHLRLSFASDASRNLKIHNLSASGMLLTLSDPLPVGAVFGFALHLPGESEPIRGQAEVVRQAGLGGPHLHHVGVRFRALGGDGRRQLRHLVESNRANDNEHPAVEAAVSPRAPAPAPESVSPSRLAPVPLGIEEAGDLQQELDELTPMLEALLERGLTSRLAAGDWYSTGAELGLDSLRSLSLILAALSEGRDGSPEASQRLNDLMEARRRLTEYSRPEQELRSRVRILIGLRPVLERLLQDFGERSGSGLTTHSGSRPVGLASRVVLEVRRLVARRRSLAALREQLERLQSPRYALARSAYRRHLETLQQEFGALAASCGLALESETLSERKALRSLIDEADLQLRHLERRLGTIHEKSFEGANRSFATHDHEADLVDARLHQALSGGLAPGVEYLVRTHAAYAHALEAAGADTTLLDRVERLGARLASAAKKRER